jgi:hypothetical protein
VGLSDADARIVGVPLCAYFAAADDQAAVAVLQTSGGPGQADLDVVFLKNIDPVVAIVQLEAVVAGCGYAEVCERPRSGQVLSEPEIGPPFVVSVTDSLVEALAGASREDLSRFGASWSITEEIQQTGMDAEAATAVLEALAGLAQRARVSRQRLYCWWAL